MNVRGDSERRSRFALRDLFAEAVASVATRPGRSLLTALGTIVGVGTFVATTGMATTARAQVGESFDLLKATEVRLVDLEPDGANPYPLDVDARLGRLNGVTSAGVLWTVDNGDLVVRASPMSTAALTGVSIMGASPGAIRAARPELSSGVIFGTFHESTSQRVAVLGRLAAKQLGINRVNGQPAIFIDDVGYTVVGIIDDVERNKSLLSSAILPASTAAALPTSDQTSFSVLIDVQPGAADLVGSQAALALRPDAPERFRALVPPDPRELRETIESDIAGLMYGLAALALVVGMIGIANTTLVAVLERRAEIGVRRALGARRYHVAAQFLTESGALGLAGGFVGASIGLVAIATVSATRSWTATVEPLYTLAGPAIGLVAGLIAGLQPAWRASKVQPARALRSG